MHPPPSLVRTWGKTRSTLVAMARPPRDSSWVAVLAFLFYAALARRECQGDGALYLYCYAIGFRDSTVHFLAFPTLRVAEWLSSTGMSQLRAATMLCALGTAIGLGFVHAAYRGLTSDRRGAACLALVVGTCPAVALYATVYELHGVFFAFVGLSCWAMSLYLRQPTRVRALLLGGCCGLSYLAHATGAVLVGVVGLFGTTLLAASRGGAWADVRAGLPRLFLAGLASVFAMLVSLLVAQMLGSAASLASAFDRALAWLYGGEEALQEERNFLGTIEHEWLLPFFPVSLLWLTALRRRELRWVVASVGVCLLGYLAVAFGIAGGLVEYGSYVLPMAVPAAWLSLQGVRKPGAAIAMAFVGLLVLHFGIPERHAEANARAGAEIRALQDQRAMFLVGWHTDLEPFFVAAPHAEWYPLQGITATPPERGRALSEVFVARIRDRLARGDLVIVTDGALRFLAGGAPPETNPSTAILAARIEESFRIEPYARESAFPCHRLVSR